MRTSLPEHPNTPFVRIVGTVINRDKLSVDDRVQWVIATHTLVPQKVSKTIRRSVEIVDWNGNVVFKTEPVIVDTSRGQLADFDDQQNKIDCRYEHIIDAHKLPAGKYRVIGRLIDEHGNEIHRTDLSVKIGLKVKLLARIALNWNLPKGYPLKNYLGGVVRVGDVDGDGEYELIHAVGAKHISVYKLSGECIFQFNDAEGAIIYNTAPFRVYDINGDGKDEIITFLGEFGRLKLTIMDGTCGKILKQRDVPYLKEIETKALEGVERLKQDPTDEVGWRILKETGFTVRLLDDGKCQGIGYGGKLLIANFGGLGNRDILVQLGDQNCTTLIAFDENLNELWSYKVDDGLGGHNPGIGDIDGDGKDEVAVGARLIDHNGRLVWVKPFDQFAAPWEDDHIDQAEMGKCILNGKSIIAYSSRVVLDAEMGKVIWIDPTWHGQEVHIGKMGRNGEYYLVFQDREYRHSGHLIHGSLFDVRNLWGDRIWSYRHGSLHMHRMLDFDGDGLMEVGFGLDIQRRPENPNFGIFDGEGDLIAVLPRYGFGADVNGDGFDELVSWTQWPDVENTIEIFGVEHTNAVGSAMPIHKNPFVYNEPD